MELTKIRIYGNLVKFSHTIFAAPFAMSVLVILWNDVTILKMLAILLCLITARTSAMAFNRLVDLKYDSANPRTLDRDLPARRVSKKEVIWLIILSAVIFIFSAGILGKYCLLLSPLVLIVLYGYTFAKRFTALAHFILGFALSLAPGGVWFALTNRFDFEPVILMLAVLLWVAGFDIIYSFQDEKFDREHNLFSVPARLGLERSLVIARILHCLSILLLILFGVTMETGIIYYLGVALFGLLLFRQHVRINLNDLKNIDNLFFTTNGVASVVYFVFTLLDQVFR